MSLPKRGLINGFPGEGQLNEPTQLLMDAAVRLAVKRNAATRRHVPSPSSVEHCTRMNWFVETGVPPTELPDAESFVSAESGRMTESLLSDIVVETGLGRIEPLTDQERELLPAQYKPLHLRGGQFDQMLLLTAKAGGHEYDNVLLEYKRKGVFGILNLHRQGLLNAEPNEYQQVQLLLAALKLNRCLYVAANWDRSALTANTRNKPRPSGIYGEWIEANPIAVHAASQRAAMQTKYILTEKVAAKVPKDYDPIGGNDWQCTWCAWRTACLAAEGITRKPGRVGQK